MPRPQAEPRAGTYPIDTGVAELTPDTIAGGWLLTVNGAQSSHIHPDPTVLDFEYMRQMTALIADRFPLDTPLRVLHLGAAACALPRFIAARYPAAKQVAVEIDGELARLSREWFDLPRAPRLRIRVGDAREVVTSLTGHTRDVIVRDAFAGARTPDHLTSTGFLQQVHRVLAPGGLYLANCGDNRDLALARAEVSTAAGVFAHVALVADAAMFKGRRTGNIVLAASDHPIIATPELVRTLLSDPQPAQMLDGPRARDFGSGAVITDAPTAG
ncbi:spermidine synthase [Gordonia sp. HNM0687]|uniref:Spermidine synthase n=1 Tax=Gordonia mangrovi TaxID=2665643 RepID=A0A6L7GR60_9ACTN|nr:fused MFS/spermidine synthase [Gordonia mangrovi]MXP21038.1 spermidine synthase [Gordonia mangrovi]UVF78417.1 fused MFS/spermidine synthase [Gordonia mangrovi]